MQNKLISIIVPVYNTEKYVNRCIDSILNQTYEDIEVILIDDGSTDKSAKICKDWKAKDKRVKVVSEKHSGASVALNKGIELASGSYISIVNNDDWLRPDNIEVSLALATKENADLTFCRIINVDEKYNRTNLNEINLSAENIKSQTYLFVEEQNNKTKNIVPCANRILIKADIAKKVKFDETLTFNENVLFVLNLIQNAKTISVTNEYLYNRFMPRKKSNKLVTLSSIENYYSKLIEFLNKNNKNLIPLANANFAHDVAKIIEKKDFVSKLDTYANSNEIFKTSINKNLISNIKQLGIKPSFKIKLLANQNYKLFKLFYK